MQIKSIQPMAAKILAEETGKMIIATKQLFYAMEVHKLLHFQNADMSAVSFAMTVHGLMDYELDLRSVKQRIRKETILTNICNGFVGRMQQNEEKEFYKLLRTAWSCSIYFLWFCGDQTIKSRGQNKYRSQLLHGMQNGGIPILIAE